MTHLTTEYHQYMKSDAWNERRRERLHHDDYTCQDCYATDKPLDVHHITYERFGDESLQDLVSVCRRCHKIRHGEPVTIFGKCQTCGEYLMIAMQRIKVFGTRWIDYMCQDGHFWSWKDE